MKAFLKHFQLSLLKKDLRKFGINLLTASIVGSFITHSTSTSHLAYFLIFWVGLTGLLALLFGLYKTDC